MFSVRSLRPHFFAKKTMSFQRRVGHEQRYLAPTPKQNLAFNIFSVIDSIFIIIYNKVIKELGGRLCGRFKTHNGIRICCADSRIFDLSGRNMNEVKVSVIMPVYNSEKYLEKCISSVLNQSLRDIELICVDDGSTDSSPRILEDFAKKDSRVKVLHQQNLFAGMARNNGMKAAAGKYFAFWDSDDYFEHDAIETMLSLCEKSGADICVCGAYSVDGETGSRAVDETFLKKRFLPREKEFSAQSNPEYIFNFASNVPWQRLFRADFVRESGLEFQPLRHANDTYFVLTTAYAAKKIVCTQKPLINYRTNNAQSITGKASKDPLCAYEAYKAAYDRLLSMGLSGKALQSFRSKLLSGLIRAVMLQTCDEAMQTVYDKIKNEGFEYFGIADINDPDYFYFKTDYEDFEAIKSCTLNEFLMFKYRKEKAGRLYYKSRAERSFKIRFARKIAGLLPANSSLYDKGKKLLHFK